MERNENLMFSHQKTATLNRCASVDRIGKKPWHVRCNSGCGKLDEVKQAPAADSSPNASTLPAFDHLPSVPTVCLSQV